MTDGRAITGMTADSHARSDIPAFFFPGISIFPDRIEPVFEIELHQAMFYFVSRYLRDIGISEIFQPPPSAPAHFPSVYDPFGLLYERLASYVFQFVSLTTTGCPLSYPPPISLLPIVSLPSSSLLCVRHRIRRNREYVSASESRPRDAVYDHLEFQFLGQECLCYWQSEALIAVRLGKSYERLSCSCSRCKLARNRLLVLINAIDRRRKKLRNFTSLRDSYERAGDRIRHFAGVVATLVPSYR